jgi:RNA 2',3'-cyclic 3'-phosphodiesterase
MGAREPLRLFLAIAIPEAILQELRRLQLELQPCLPQNRAHWTRPGQFHLTLKFLGNVPASDIDALSKKVCSLCASAPPLRLRAEGVGFFPNALSPRVFWVGIKSLDGLLPAFQQQLENVVQPYLEKTEVSKFVPHLTLARFEKLPRDAIKKLQARLQTAQVFGEWIAQEVQLIESQLSPSGALHAILDTFETKRD